MSKKDKIIVQIDELGYAIELPSELRPDEIADRIEQEISNERAKRAIEEPAAQAPETFGQGMMRRGLGAAATMVTGPVPALSTLASMSTKALGEQDFAQSMREQGATAARIGIPVAAGLVAAPAVGTGLTAAAALSGISGTSSAIAEFVGQVIDQAGKDKMDIDTDKIAGAFVGGLNPFATKGSLLKRAVINVPSAYTGSELSRFISSGEDWKNYKFASTSDLEGFTRSFAPAAIGLAAGVGGRGRELSNEARANTAVIRNNGYTGPITLGMGLPGKSAMEADAFARQNQLARRLVDDLNGSLDDQINQAFPNVPDTDPLKKQLDDAKGLLQARRDSYFKAKAEADQAALIAQDARAKNQQNSKALLADANLKAFRATTERVALSAANDMVFGGQGIRSIDELTSARRGQELIQLASGADDFVKEAVDMLYDSTGFGRNFTVVTRDDFMKRVNDLAKSSKNPVQGKILREQMKTLGDAFFQKFGDGKGRLSLEGFRMFKNEIYNGFKAVGRSDAEAGAAMRDAYRAISEASENYVSRVDPSALPRMQAANALAASRFSAIDNPTYGMIERGESDSLFKYLMDEVEDASKVLKGNTVMQDVDNIVRMIASTADPADPKSVNAAVVAGESFRQKFLMNMRDTLLRRSEIVGSGERLSPAAFDTGKIISQLDTLSAKGFPIEELGIGTPKQIKALARIQTLSKTAAVTPAEYERFLVQAVEFGADQAAWRMEYGRALRDQLLSTGSKTRRAQTARLVNARKNAKINEQDAADALREAEKDPLVMFLADNGTSMKLSDDPANNIKWVDKLLTVEPSVLNDFTAALQASGRVRDLDNLRVAAASTVMRRFGTAASGEATRADLNALSEFFDNKNQKYVNQRNSLRALLGNDAFDNLENMYGTQVRFIVDERNKMMGGQTEATRQAVNVRGRLPGKGFTAYFNPQQFEALLRDQSYNQMYRMYIDPRYAQKFEAAFTATEAAVPPALRAIMNISRIEDDRNRQGNRPNR
jgi:hypothetical protein